ncbi:HNH endonuclease signature motif containing protein [Fuscibacter oryzae]|uniref:HNH endonuclease n=1 Tax=Fuscibacter oryzae TaxID=2803939 RepID=A0A8J7MVU8_9RHOB|nr:HNH endonuclease [Fuscibacter oryzae]MBL4928784.1 HNH endonuclease [Fuscibacter oryzae]
MPIRAPRICGCGKAVPPGGRCPCRATADAERKARFDKTRPSARARGYDSDWKSARIDFLKAHPLCRCGAPATVVDHIKPHKGDNAIFWDRTNWQALCRHHHNSTKQRLERRATQGA